MIHRRIKDASTTMTTWRLLEDDMIVLVRHGEATWYWLISWWDMVMPRDICSFLGDTWWWHVIFAPFLVIRGDATWYLLLSWWYVVMPRDICSFLGDTWWCHVILASFLVIRGDATWYLLLSWWYVVMPRDICSFLGAPAGCNLTGGRGGVSDIRD